MYSCLSAMRKTVEGELLKGTRRLWVGAWWGVNASYTALVYNCDVLQQH